MCALILPDGGDLVAHMREFEVLFDRLEAAETSLDSDTLICMLLRSLPSSYDGVVTALDCLADDDISLEIVKAKLEDEYSRQQERKGGSRQVWAAWTCKRELPETRRRPEEGWKFIQAGRWWRREGEGRAERYARRRVHRRRKANCLLGDRQCQRSHDQRPGLLRVAA
uniref:(northern house mosquito) hypothetical protein n=1 Tax=Culex pipiens TaxID=7175 RepID=A0A8D8CHD2_CULPI